MRNYFNLLLEKERISAWPAILRGTKYGFIVNYIGQIIVLSFVAFSNLGGSPDTLEDPSPWFVAESPTIIVFITGWLTGILLSFSLRLFIDLDPFRFIKIQYLRNLLIVPVFFLGIYAMHYLNLWLIGLF